MDEAVEDGAAGKAPARQQEGEEERERDRKEGCDQRDPEAQPDRRPFRIGERREHRSPE